MLDSRWVQLADILVNYSTTTGSGDRVLITMMETDTWPLARSVHAAAIRVRAFPHITESVATVMICFLMKK
jgi:leucyl aminopeptidase (aminopeptidase T)